MPSKRVIIAVVVAVICAIVAGVGLYMYNRPPQVVCGSLLPGAVPNSAVNRAGFCYQPDVVHGAGAFGVGHSVANTPDAGACAEACARDPLCSLANWNRSTRSCWGYTASRTTIESHPPTPNTSFVAVVDSHAA